MNEQDDVFRKIAEGVKAIMSANAEVAAVNSLEIIIEDKADVENQVTRGLASVGGIWCVIAVISHVKNSGNGENLSGSVGVELTFFENPSVNRANGEGTFSTAQQTALAAIHALNWKELEGDGGRFNYHSMRRLDDDATNVVVVEFTYEKDLDNGSVTWGVEGTIFGAKIKTRRVRKAASQVIDYTDSDGQTKKGMCRDRHLVVELTATVKGRITVATLPEICDNFVIPIDGTSTVFECRDAEIVSEAEAETTIRLSGRTVPGATPRN